MSTKSFDDFAKRCAAASLRAVDCGQGHWRILGGLVPVNYYPLSKGRTIWVQGTTGRTSFGGTPAQAIAAARGEAPTLAPGLVPTKRPGQNWSRRIRKKWMKAGPRCYWCKCKLGWSTMTVDHRVPLYRGGANTEDNLVPACQPCNLRRGHELGAPKSKAETAVQEATDSLLQEHLDWGFVGELRPKAEGAKQ